MKNEIENQLAVVQSDKPKIICLFDSYETWHLSEDDVPSWNSYLIYDLIMIKFETLNNGLPNVFEVRIPTKSEKGIFIVFEQFINEVCLKGIYQIMKKVHMSPNEFDFYKYIFTHFTNKSDFLEFFKTYAEQKQESTLFHVIEQYIFYIVEKMDLPTVIKFLKINQDIEIIKTDTIENIRINNSTWHEVMVKKNQEMLAQELLKDL
jgi:hypothetical protein